MECVAVDLFCGIGGLTYGVQISGINVVAGIDIDPSCRYAFERNTKAKFINSRVENIKTEELKKLYPENSVKILMGCAPCQPFSNYSLRYNKFGRKDDKWKLLYYFGDIVGELRPHIVSMENVPQLAKEKVFRDFTEQLISYGYYVDWGIANCADYGVPQTRNRLVLLASTFAEIQLIPPLFDRGNYMTVKDAISHLPKIKDGQEHDHDKLHRASRLSLKNKARIAQSVPGGTWSDWDEELRLPCHKKSTGERYRSIYGRMEWDKPSPTITTQFYGYGNGRFGHPDQSRAISLREGALLQSFPPNYDFIDRSDIPTTKQLGIHIGNAVPVLLGRAIGQSIKEHVNAKLKVGA